LSKTKNRGENTTTYKIKAERWSEDSHSYWDCELEITVKDGRITHVEETEE